MLSIRMQRLGRKGHPMYRVVVQDSRQSPDSGKYIALLGNFDPHNKTANIVKEKAEHYLKHGAQPSERVVKLFKSEKIALPAWVKEPAKQERKTRNPEKLRKNRPVGTPAPEKPAEEATSQTEVAQAEASEEATESTSESEQPAEETTEETEETKQPKQADETAETPEAEKKSGEADEDSTDKKA